MPLCVLRTSPLGVTGPIDCLETQPSGEANTTHSLCHWELSSQSKQRDAKGSSSPELVSGSLAS
jgi:hypothetical protein